MGIFSSLVNDGICDCCDGSDEQNNERVNCPNRCSERAKEEAADFVELRKKLQQGIQVKHSLIAVAKSKLGRKQAEKTKIERNLEQKRSELAQKEQNKKNAEEAEKIYKAEKEKRAEAEKQRKIEEAKKTCEANGGANCEAIQTEESEQNESENEREESPRERRRS